jgi:hypothetical protein
MQKDTAPSATALFLGSNISLRYRGGGKCVHMTVWTADNQTVGCEILLQLRKKPIAGCETTNEEHGLHENKLAIQWQ